MLRDVVSMSERGFVLGGSVVIAQLIRGSTFYCQDVLASIVSSIVLLRSFSANI